MAGLDWEFLWFSTLNPQNHEHFGMCSQRRLPPLGVLRGCAHGPAVPAVLSSPVVRRPGSGRRACKGLAALDGAFSPQPPGPPLKGGRLLAARGLSRLSRQSPSVGLLRPAARHGEMTDRRARAVPAACTTGGLECARPTLALSRRVPAANTARWRRQSACAHFLFLRGACKSGPSTPCL